MAARVRQRGASRTHPDFPISASQERRPLRRADRAVVLDFVHFTSLEAKPKNRPPIGGRSRGRSKRDLFHEDHLQTPMALERWPTSGSSTIVWSAEYKPWGHAQVAGGSTAVVDQRFPGQWYDAETESRTWVSGVNTLQRPGLAQNWMREYDPWVGGYSEVDSLLRDPHLAPIKRRLPPFALIEPVATRDISAEASGFCTLAVPGGIPLAPNPRCGTPYCCPYDCETTLSSWIKDAGLPSIASIFVPRLFTVNSGGCPPDVEDPGPWGRTDFGVCVAAGFAAWMLEGL